MAANVTPTPAPVPPAAPPWADWRRSLVQMGWTPPGVAQDAGITDVGNPGGGGYEPPPVAGPPSPPKFEPGKPWTPPAPSPAPAPVTPPVTAPAPIPGGELLQPPPQPYQPPEEKRDTNGAPSGPPPSTLPGTGAAPPWSQLVNEPAEPSPTYSYNPYSGQGTYSPATSGSTTPSPAAEPVPNPFTNPLAPTTADALVGGLRNALPPLRWWADAVKSVADFAKRLRDDTGRAWTNDEIYRFAPPNVKAAMNALGTAGQQAQAGGYGEPPGAFSEVPPPATAAAPSPAWTPSGKGSAFPTPWGMGGAAPTAPAKTTPVVAPKSTTPVAPVVPPKATAPAPAPAPRGGGGGGGGGGAPADNGLPEQWNTFFNKIFGPMESYYTPERGGVTQAPTDYKTFQNLWSGKLNRWLTPEELARALGEFYAIAENLKTRGHTVTLGDLYSWTQRQIYDLPAPPTVTPIKPGEV
jgi:hypothetical protein